MSVNKGFIEIENIPKNCRECGFKGAISETDSTYCTFNCSWMDPSNERPSTCPIKEYPQEKGEMLQ